MTDYAWIVGDVLRHPDGRLGLVVGLHDTTVTVRLPGGGTEQWPAHELRGTGEWRRP